MRASAAVVMPRQAIRPGNRPECHQTPASPTVQAGGLFESMRGGGPLLPLPRRLASAEWLSKFNDDAALEISLEVLQGSQPAPRATGRVRGQKFRPDLLPPIFRSNVSFRFLSDVLPSIKKKTRWRKRIEKALVPRLPFWQLEGGTRHFTAVGKRRAPVRDVERSSQKEREPDDATDGISSASGHQREGIRVPWSEPARTACRWSEREGAAFDKSIR